MEPRNSFTDAAFAGRIAPRAEGAFRLYWRVHYAVRAAWRRVRIARWITRLLGPQYRRSRDLIEIDITYACNLHCLNCNRSVTQAPEALHMPLERVASFVEESISRGKRWRSSSSYSGTFARTLAASSRSLRTGTDPTSKRNSHCFRRRS
jgi:hypothetical protein